MEKIMGWEVSRQLEKDKPTVRERLIPQKSELTAAGLSLSLFLLLFLLACYAPGIYRDRASDIPVRLINWWVVILAVVLEFLDSAAGMGYGTAITPLLMLLGYDPLQIVPAVMIQQAAAGLTTAFLHREFSNVEWRFRPLSETVRLCLIITVAGCIATIVSITAVYAVFKTAENWIRLYVAVLLIIMGVVSLVRSAKKRPYQPMKMFFFGALAGFNKGIGGGGYGPVVTIGGLLSGVPVKTMTAVTSFSEGIVCTVSVIVWLSLMKYGVNPDFILLPSMLLGSMVAVVAAPYAVKIIPQKTWNWFVPAYSCCLAVFCLIKVVGYFL